MRRQRWQDVLHSAVFVDVAGHAQRRQFAHFIGAGDRAAEDEDRQPTFVEFADRPDQVDAGGEGEPQVEDDEIEFLQIGTHSGQQFCGTASGHRTMPRFLQRGLKPLPHEYGIVGDQNGLGSGTPSGHRFYLSGLERVDDSPGHRGVTSCTVTFCTICPLPAIIRAFPAHPAVATFVAAGGGVGFWSYEHLARRVGHGYVPRV